MSDQHNDIHDSANSATTPAEQTDTTNSANKSANKSATKGPGVRVPPPLIFLSCLLVGAGLHRAVPVALGIPAVLTWTGLVFMAAGIVILTLCWLAFRRAKTAIEPWKPTTSMVYDGCYRFSRNPIYLSMCLVLFGIGLFANSLWLFVSGIPCGFFIYIAAIRKEEAYLERQFGESYLHYKQRVRRWI